jgi:FdhD protein
MTDAHRTVPSLKIGHQTSLESLRAVPEETPIAIVFDGATHAVMMATPQDVRDFALGFSFTEGHIQSAADIQSIDIVEQDNGIEARVWLVSQAGNKITARRRAIAGPTGCGLCGVESLAEAVPQLSAVAKTVCVSPDDIHRALASLAPQQDLNIRTRAVHAAGYWSASKGLIAIREDVGRHNALDKLVGALIASNQTVSDGIVVLTSRVSVEMVQKTVRLGAEVIVAVSAPTALAIRTAEAAGVTLIAVARQDGFEVFTHGERLQLAALSTNDNGSKRHAL